ncbi:RHS repeat-associated core domain-containing protein [Clostridium sp. 19966]|nr:RHS repeat-associated core domain-containing protein [Clostridium sp. 19966]
MNLNGVEYYYIRNGQGDIIGLFDKAGATVASYTYDTWGKLISIKDGSGADITNNTASVGYKNPYRYRGYRYDTETGLYYLQSRYYNSDWGRFINADGDIGVQGNLLSHNLFAYCKNNPANGVDSEGFSALSVFGWIIDAGEAVIGDINPFSLGIQIGNEFFPMDSYSTASDDTLGNGIVGGAQIGGGVDIAANIYFASAGRSGSSGGNSGGNSNNSSGKYPKDKKSKKAVIKTARFKNEGEARAVARTKVGKNPVKTEDYKLRSINGKSQYRAKPSDILGEHGEGPHIHLERLNPDTGEVEENWHFYWDNGR